MKVKGSWKYFTDLNYGHSSSIIWISKQTILESASGTYDQEVWLVKYQVSRVMKHAFLA